MEKEMEGVGKDGELIGDEVWFGRGARLLLGEMECLSLCERVLAGFLLVVLWGMGEGERWRVET